MSTDRENDGTKRTAFHDSFAALGAEFVAEDGLWLPESFSGRGIESECRACRESVSIVDRSNLKKFEVLGPDAEQLLQYCTTRNMNKLSVGQVVCVSMCNAQGGVIDVGTVYRLDADCFRWVCTREDSGAWLHENARALSRNAWVKSATDRLATLSVQGPNARAVLESILWTAPSQPTVSELGAYRFTVARIGGLQGTPLVVSRTGNTGAGGFDVFCHPRDGTAVFDAIWTAGSQYSIALLGCAGLNVLRIEAGIAAWGHELDEHADPFSAGLGFTVSLETKSDDFIGREALERLAARTERVLVGLELAGSEVPEEGASLHFDGAVVGALTSAVFSHALARPIALAKLEPAHSSPGTSVEVGAGGLFVAKVAELPHVQGVNNQ